MTATSMKSGGPLPSRSGTNGDAIGDRTDPTITKQTTVTSRLLTWSGCARPVLAGIPARAGRAQPGHVGNDTQDMHQELTQDESGETKWAGADGIGEQRAQRISARRGIGGIRQRAERHP